MTGALERLDSGSPAPHCGIDRVEPVSAKDGQNGKPIRPHPVDAAEQRVHAGPIFMMHLRKFTRLSQRIGLIHEQDTHRSGLTVCAAGAGKILADTLKCPGQQGGHLPDGPAAASREAEGVERHISTCFAGDRLTEDFSEFGLPHPEIGLRR